MFGKAKTSGCGFSGEAVVDYVFGEMIAERSAAFEAHLVGCDACIAELAAVSEARFEVYEWRKLAFDPLATPVVRIPYGEAAPAGFGAARISQFFAVSRLWAAVGLAAACVAAGAFIAVSGTYWNSGGTEMADAVPDLSAPAAVSPTEFKQDISPAPILTVTPAKPVSERHAPLKAKAALAVSARPSATQLAVRRPAARTNRTRNAVPTLSGYTAEEDSSLRLADVFEDIGGSIR